MNYKKEIIKELEKILPTGNDQSAIFEDWLSLSLACLEMLPAHAKSVVSGQGVAQDTPETQELYKRLRSKYKDEYFSNFAKALSILMTAADDTWEDVLGDTYMEWGWPNSRAGQFFTPWHLAEMTAQMTVDTDDLYKRIHSAYMLTSTGKMHEMITSPERVAKFVRENPEAVIPLCGMIDPIKIQDCACGSGVMLLGAASCYPRWALDWGMVQFYGQDIDQTCVMMARINMMLHGLNGYAMKLEVAVLDGSKTLADNAEPGIMDSIQ